MVGYGTDWRHILFYDFSIGIFFINMILLFNLGFYEEGVIVQDRRKICKRYIKWQLIVELVTLISLLSEIKWINLVILLRI